MWLLRLACNTEQFDSVYISVVILWLQSALMLSFPPFGRFAIDSHTVLARFWTNYLWLTRIPTSMHNSLDLELQLHSSRWNDVTPIEKISSMGLVGVENSCSVRLSCRNGYCISDHILRQWIHSIQLRGCFPNELAEGAVPGNSDLFVMDLANIWSSTVMCWQQNWQSWQMQVNRWQFWW